MSLSTKKPYQSVQKICYDSFSVIENTTSTNQPLCEFLIPGIHNPNTGQLAQLSTDDFVKSPWRCTLQSGGTRKHKIVFGYKHRQQYKEFAKTTLRAWMETTNKYYSNTGMFKLFIRNNVNDSIGLDDSLLDYSWEQLFDCNDQDYSIEFTFDMSIHDDRKERIQSLMDSRGDVKVYRNPLGQLTPQVPLIVTIDSEDSPKYLNEHRFKNYCVNFAPTDCMSPDQLKQRYSQQGYVKFHGDRQIIQKMGTRDFIIVSTPVWLDAQDGIARMKLKPGRPYELKSDSRTVGTNGVAHIIHIWKQV